MSPNVIGLTAWAPRAASPQPAPEPARFHADQPIPAYPPSTCPRDAIYWVISDASQRLSCGPHLQPTLSQLRAEHPVIAGTEPDPGQPCDYQEATA